MTPAELENNLANERRLSDELRKYAGQWVAIRDHQVVAHAATPEKLDEQLKSEDSPYRSFRVVRGSALL
jgi:hypothetical protein